VNGAAFAPVIAQNIAGVRDVTSGRSAVSARDGNYFTHMPVPVFSGWPIKFGKTGHPLAAGSLNRNVTIRAPAAAD